MMHSNNFTACLRLVVTAGLCVILQNCSWTNMITGGAADSSDMSAAVYYGWVASISDSARRGELQRLESRTDDDLIAVVQRAIVQYHLNQNASAIAMVNFEHPRMPACEQSASCEDYIAFVEVFRELSNLQQEYLRQRDYNQVLEDRIRNLDQQIEALTNIEQQLLERQQRPD